MGNKKRKKRSRRQVPDSDGETSSMPPLTTTDEEMEDVPSASLPQNRKPRKARNELSKRISKEIKDEEKQGAHVVDAEVNLPSHSTTAYSKSGRSCHERTSFEEKSGEQNKGAHALDVELNMSSHSKAEHEVGNHLTGGMSIEKKNTETDHGASSADTETNMTSASKTVSRHGSDNPAYRIKPNRRMVHRLQTLLSHEEVIEIAYLTDQPPDFILKISEHGKPLHLLMANLEKQGIVSEDNFEALIEVLREIAATEAIELVQTFTSSSTCQEEKPNAEIRLPKSKEPDESLHTVSLVANSRQQGAIRAVDKKSLNASRHISHQERSSTSTRGIACSWQDLNPLLYSIGISTDDNQKLSVVDAIALHQTHFDESVVTPENVLVAFLSRLMSYDHRSIRIFKELGKREFHEIGKPHRSRAKNNIHRKVSCRDIIHAIIRNCDPFLQQELLSKLSACQLAIPILMPNTSHGLTLLLWGLQRVTKAWQDPRSSQVFEETVVNYPFPVVTALRIGNVGFSKSSILNKMLGSCQGNDDHPYFLCHEQDSKGSILSSGTVEAVWYLPRGGKKSDQSLSEAICFLNIRGEATDLIKQRQFASTYSLITIVFISKKEMHIKHDQITDLSQKSHVIVVMGSSDASTTQREEESDETEAVILRNERKSIFDASQMNKLDISERLCVEIKSILESPRNIADDVKSLDNTRLICKEHRINVDISNEECMKAKEAAEKVLHTCKEGPKAYKSHALPLQLNWQEWSRLDKDRSWKGAQGDTERELAKLHKAKEEQRKKQREIGLSTEIQTLFKELSNPSPTYKQYLLFWLQHSLNETSVASLRPLVNNLKTIRNEMRETAAKITHLQRKVGNDSSVSTRQRENVQRQIKELTAKETTLQKDLLRNTAEFDASSLGFEHFVREFGQIYESFHNNPRRNESNVKAPFDVKSLPKMAAEMLLSGQPLEIFDGDACHVPIKWIKGVLAALRDIVGEATVYVISVIGIQSSGKSTLLNSMFGVRFAVSAGRCTRGVFLQMLPVSEDLKSDINCDYVVIIDTEGLKAPEKALANRKNEDNELATFALCLSDMTLINIGGQTVGEDLSNILQISAHAFIRMKEVHLRSSCYLIQQFVADITARHRNESSTQSILQKLDQAVVTAAIEERKQDQYRQFSDCFYIVNIDSESQSVQYIPSLWRSSMSAPNHEYSETVLRLKSFLLKEAKHQWRMQKISELSNRIDNVWNAIKQEDFVFNFRNTNEISQYNNFTRFYKKQQLNLSQEMMNWELEAKQKIKNTTADNVQNRQTILLKELDEKLSTLVDKTKTILEEELKSKDYESVGQHSTFFYRDLDLVQIQARETIRSMLNLESSIILNAKQKDQLLPQLIAKLRRKVLMVAERIKLKLSENNEDDSKLINSQLAVEEVKAIFEEEWSNEMASVELQYPTTNEDDMKRSIESDIHMCIMESLQNTSLSKDMKELLNSHKLSALCQDSPVVKSKEDIAEAKRLIGPCSSEITHIIKDLINSVHKSCIDGTFHFSADFVHTMKRYFSDIISQTCNGCKDKSVLLTCVSCCILQNAHDATKHNILDLAMKNANLLKALGKEDISSERKIKQEVTEQLKLMQPRIHGGIIHKLGNIVGLLLPSWHSYNQRNENFLNELRRKFNLDIARIESDRWYCVEKVKSFIEMAQELINCYPCTNDRARQQLLGDACTFFIREAFQSERKALAKDLSWMMVQVTLKYEAIELGDQINIFVNVLRNILPDKVCKNLTGFSEDMVEKLSRITLTEDRRHSLDEFFILNVPLLDREKYDTILSVMRDYRELFLALIESSGVYNTNLIRNLVTDMNNELTRHNNLGRVEQSLVLAHVCSWALPICCGIHLTFERENSVQAQLEKEKKRLFLDFKSLCEGACHDKLAAKSVCATIEDALKDRLKTRICSVLFEKFLKAGNEIFYSRTRFLQVVLESMCKEENFDNYSEFLHQHFSFIQKWTLNFIATQCCDDCESRISIEDIALYEIDQLVRSTEESLESTLRDLNEDSEGNSNLFEIWANIFSENFETNLSSSLNEEKVSALSLHLVLTDCTLFTQECTFIVRSAIKDSLLESLMLPDTSLIQNIKEWFIGLPKKLHDLLAESVRGCGSQCPFCKTFCDDTIKEHNVHMSNLHFPNGVGGWRIRSTQKLVCDTCTANVASSREYYNCYCPGHTCSHPTRPYREYKADYPDWDIKPISDYEATLYWKWVLTRFNEEFSRYYHCRTADIPWGAVTKAEALESIRNANS